MTDGDGFFIKTFLQWGWGIVLLYTGHVHRSQKKQDDALGKQADRITDIERSYIPRAEHQDAYNRVDAKLDKILDKLERKVDRDGN